MMLLLCLVRSIRRHLNAIKAQRSVVRKCKLDISYGIATMPISLACLYRAPTICIVFDVALSVLDVFFSTSHPPPSPSSRVSLYHLVNSVINLFSLLISRADEDALPVTISVVSFSHSPCLPPWALFRRFSLLLPQQRDAKASSASVPGKTGVGKGSKSTSKNEPRKGSADGNPKDARVAGIARGVSSDQAGSFSRTAAGGRGSGNGGGSGDGSDGGASALKKKRKLRVATAREQEGAKNKRAAKGRDGGEETSNDDRGSSSEGRGSPAFSTDGDAHRINGDSDQDNRNGKKHCAKRGDASAGQTGKRKQDEVGARAGGAGNAQGIGRGKAKRSKGSAARGNPKQDTDKETECDGDRGAVLAESPAGGLLQGAAAGGPKTTNIRKGGRGEQTHMGSRGGTEGRTEGENADDGLPRGDGQPSSERAKHVTDMRCNDHLPQHKADLDAIVPCAAPPSPGWVEGGTGLSQNTPGQGIRAHGRRVHGEEGSPSRPSSVADLRATVVGDTGGVSDGRQEEQQREGKAGDAQEEEEMARGWVSPPPPSDASPSNNNAIISKHQSRPRPPAPLLPQRLTISEEEDSANDGDDVEEALDLLHKRATARDSACDAAMRSSAAVARSRRGRHTGGAERGGGSSVASAANVVPVHPVPSSAATADPHTLAAAHVLISGLGL